LDTPLIITAEDPEQVRESQTRLARVGIENVAGFLAGGVAGWIQHGFELDYIPQITVQDYVELRTQEPGRIAVLDVREPGEVAGGVIENSLCIPLGRLDSRLAELDREKLLVVHCKGGYRSSIASSILRRRGFRDVANLTGGFDAWRNAGLPFSVPGSAAS
jgi:rhodanese-related sulfurtransferase